MNFFHSIILLFYILASVVSCQIKFRNSNVKKSVTYQIRVIWAVDFKSDASPFYVISKDLMVHIWVGLKIFISHNTFIFMALVHFLICNNPCNNRIICVKKNHNFDMPKWTIYK